MKNLAVFLPNWIGDVVMATPALRNLRQHIGPNAKVVGVARPYVREVLTGSSWLDEMVWYDHKSKDKTLRVPNVVQRLREQEVEEVLLLTNSFRAAWVAWRSGARERVGYARNFRKYLLTLAPTPKRAAGRAAGRIARGYEPISAVDYYLELVQEMGVRVQSRQPELYTTARGELGADEIWGRFGWEPYHSVIGLNAGGAFGAAKHWPNQHSAQLALRLAQQGHRVLIFCGPKEVDTAREIEDLARNPYVRSMAYQDLSLEVSKSCLRRCNLLVTTDSGPRHIAASFDIPTVVLFGPIDPIWSHNYATSSIEMFDKLECSPCGKRVCPLRHHRCMNELTPERVLGAVNQLLGDQSEADRAA